MCQGMFPWKEEQAPWQSAAILGLHVRRTASGGTREQLRRKGLEGKKESGVVGCHEYLDVPAYTCMGTSMSRGVWEWAGTNLRSQHLVSKALSRSHLQKLQT